VPEVFAAQLATNRSDIGQFGLEHQLVGATDTWNNNVFFPEIEEDLSNIEIESLNFHDLFDAREVLGRCLVPAKG
jgi:hypothetical protein